MNDPETFQGRTRAELQADADALVDWFGICLALGVLGMIGYGLQILVGGWWRLAGLVVAVSLVLSALWLAVGFVRR